MMTPQEIKNLLDLGSTDEDIINTDPTVTIDQINQVKNTGQTVPLRKQQIPLIPNAMMIESTRGMPGHGGVAFGDQSQLPPNKPQESITQGTPKPPTPPDQQGNEQQLSPDMLNYFQQLQAQGLGGMPMPKMSDYGHILKNMEKAGSEYSSAMQDYQQKKDKAEEYAKHLAGYDNEMEKIRWDEKIAAEQRQEAADKFKTDYEQWKKETPDAPSRGKANDAVFGTGAKGFFSRIAGALAVGMGAYAAIMGRTGRNFAQETIDRAIDQEIESQKQQVAMHESKGRNIINGWSVASKTFDDKDIATKALKTRIIEKVQDYMNGPVLGNMVKTAEQRKMLAEINLGLTQKNSNLEMEMNQIVDRNSTNLAQLQTTQQAAKVKANETLNMEQAKLLGRVMTSDAGKKLAEAETALNNINQYEKKFYDELKKQGPAWQKIVSGSPDWATKTLGTEGMARIKALQSEHSVVSRNVMNLGWPGGVVNQGGESDTVENLVPMPGDNKEVAKGKFAHLKRMVLNNASGQRGVIDNFLGKSGITSEHVFRNFPTLYQQGKGDKYTDKAVKNKPSTPKVGK